MVDSKYDELYSVNRQSTSVTRTDTFLNGRAPLFIGLISGVSTYNYSSEAIKNWERYFPNGTDPDFINTSEIKPELTLTNIANASERIQDILRYFSLSKTQLKDICGVSRQTLYDWLSGKFEPEGNNYNKLRKIHELSLLVPKFSNVPLRSSLLLEPISNGASLFDLLSNREIDAKQTSEVIGQLVTLASTSLKESALSVRKRLGFKETDHKEQISNLQENLKIIESE